MTEGSIILVCAVILSYSYTDRYSSKKKVTGNTKKVPFLGDENLKKGDEKSKKGDH